MYLFLQNDGGQVRSFAFRLGPGHGALWLSSRLRFGGQVRSKTPFKGEYTHYTLSFILNSYFPNSTQISGALGPKVSRVPLRLGLSLYRCYQRLGPRLGPRKVVPYVIQLLNLLPLRLAETGEIRFPAINFTIRSLTHSVAELT